MGPVSNLGAEKVIGLEGIWCGLAENCGKGLGEEEAAGLYCGQTLKTCMSCGTISELFFLLLIKIVGCVVTNNNEADNKFNAVLSFCQRS